ncbi:hypothetical protein Thiowin_00526 [Thiorhodovibrio winogradskyi]|uniref:Uncharacterized protein n=1 Tax=Thiorhodovibrio winogradskyi TaxID=77007 RepID=A0ABZ0S382_9GAMM|nr:hypothetical protein [Thiorhodovibrio winogradskyi]
MTAIAIKQEAIDAIQGLPEEANTEDIMYRLYVLESIRQGRKDAERGATKTQQDVLEEIRGWSAGPITR